MVKTLGYLVSAISVVLLAVPAWQAAQRDETVMLCLIAGAIASLTGMALRSISYQMSAKL